MDRNLFPIIEFDQDRAAIFRPELLLNDIGAPENCVLCFFPKAIESLLSAYPHREIGTLMSEDSTLPVYAVEYEGNLLCVMQARVGGPCAAAQMEELYVMGCRRFLACGSCGVLREDLAAGHLLIPTAAIRDEGTSYHYLPPSREVVLDAGTIYAIEDSLSKAGIPYIKGKTWTTDAVYRETRARVAQREKEGCIAVEMECASWAAVASYLDVRFGQILYAGDTLGGEEWDMRDFPHLHDVRERVLHIALRVCSNLSR